MNLHYFPLFADENIHPEVVAFLRNEGFDVQSVMEEGLQSMDDAPLFQLAHSRGRVVVTHDRAFGESAFTALEPFTGLISIRPGNAKASVTIQTLRWLLAHTLDLRPGFILVVEHTGHGPRLRIRVVDQT